MERTAVYERAFWYINLQSLTFSSACRCGRTNATLFCLRGSNSTKMKQNRRKPWKESSSSSIATNYDVYLYLWVSSIMSYLTHSDSLVFANRDIRADTADIYWESDTHQLLHADSAHPKHTVKGILKSRLIRFKGICSSKSDYDRACTELFQVLHHRGIAERCTMSLNSELGSPTIHMITPSAVKIKITMATKSGRLSTTMTVCRSGWLRRMHIVWNM